ncbi:putative ubiquitin carboxyl-terminal hydrolase [Podosphaera aphanis]|nr:putative ubiquitin carboxyl-terminal hydrolase [Podosphaera aphanis]
MSSLFSRLKGATSAVSVQGANSLSLRKKDVEPESDATPLVRMLQNAGPVVRQDGSDKFYGMENFGNTCYCNSIVQALYYSVPFRNHMVNFPPTSNCNPPEINLNIKPDSKTPIQNSATAKQKDILQAESTKKKYANLGHIAPNATGYRPDENLDSPESKKKYAMLTGPILEIKYECASSYGMEESTFTALKDIFMAIIDNKSRTGVLSPQRFLEIFKRDNEMFRTSMHQDAHEFYGLLLNAVISNVETYAQRTKDQSPLIETTEESSIKSVSPSAMHGTCPKEDSQISSTGWVHEIFEGVLTSETKCLTCETTSQRDETFLDLSIDLDEHSSVTSCLRKFSAEEMLCERNKFHCDNCGGLQEAERRMKIKRLPKILALHLKRFKYTEDMTRLQKLFHRVVYPYYLRMFNTTDDAVDPDRLYELYAVVVHIGGNAYHGHYVSVIKTQDHGWLLFDDEMVEPVDNDFVRNFFGNKSGMACAYVLFYQETTVEAMHKEQEFEKVTEFGRDPCPANEESGPALRSSASDNLQQSTSAKTIVHKTVSEDRDSIILDETTKVEISDATLPSSAIPLPLQQLPKPLVPSKAMIKDKKALEKRENKEAQKILKANKKALVKERKNQAKELKKGPIKSKISSTEHDSRMAEQETPQSSQTEPMNGRHERSLSRTQPLNKGAGRSFSLMGGTKVEETSKASITPAKKSEIDLAVEDNIGAHLLDKKTKYIKEKFSFMSLGRKKSSLFPT